MEPGLSYELVKKIAAALDAEQIPPVKDGVAYRIMVFKVTDSQKWVCSMVPLSAGSEPSEIFDQINDAYGKYLSGRATDFLFFEHDLPAHLIQTVTNWYYGTTERPSVDQAGTSSD